MRVLSLFSGIGGLELGLEWAGFQTVGQCEIDPACRFWLEEHWPGVPRWADVREVTADAVEAACGAIDVVAGGPPCQPASVAGRRQGSADVRWLWPEFLRVCREVGPRWVVAENPLGIASLEPHGLDWVCGELEGSGYEVWPVIVGADDVGAPHRRKRVWIVAHGDERGRPVERLSGLLDGERAAQRDDADRRGERPVGEPTGSGLEGQRADAGGAAQLQPRLADCRWPSRPGQPQHEWEAPRLAHPTKRGRDAQSLRSSIAPEGDGPLDAERAGTTGTGAGQPQPGLGVAVAGLPDWVAGRITSRHRREALKALGNSVVPQCAQVIGKAILAAEGLA